MLITTRSLPLPVLTRSKPDVRLLRQSHLGSALLDFLCSAQRILLKSAHYPYLRDEDCASDEASILDLRLENFSSTLECQQILSTFLAKQAVDLFQAEGCRRFIIDCD